MDNIPKQPPEILNEGDPMLSETIVDKLKTIFDPELPVDIYALGLIYRLEINSENELSVQMTLTTPGCPVAQTFPEMIQEKLLEIETLRGVKVELVWEPAWDTDRLSDATKLELGLI